MLPTLSTTHYNDRRSPENDPRKQQEGRRSLGFMAECCCLHSPATVLRDHGQPAGITKSAPEPNFGHLLVDYRAGYEAAFVSDRAISDDVAVDESTIRCGSMWVSCHAVRVGCSGLMRCCICGEGGMPSSRRSRSR
jgi:hypothetical protein